ncbi:hypothetical protein [Glaciecola sp. 1036]
MPFESFEIMDDFVERPWMGLQRLSNGTATFFKPYTSDYFIS